MLPFTIIKLPKNFNSYLHFEIKQEDIQTLNVIHANYPPVLCLKPVSDILTPNHALPFWSSYKQNQWHNPVIQSSPFPLPYLPDHTTTIKIEATVMGSYNFAFPMAELIADDRNLTYDHGSYLFDVRINLQPINYYNDWHTLAIGIIHFLYQ